MRTTISQNNVSTLRYLAYNEHVSFHALALLIMLLTAITCRSAALDAGNAPTVVASSSSQFRLSKSELKIWNDPGFKRRFIESYIAETDIEPTVTIDEREQMQEVLELISSDKMDEAAKELKKLQNEAASAVYDFTLANIYFQQEKLD